MAIDTRGKRASVLSYDAVFIFPLVPADGTIAQWDRQQVVWSYGGLLGADSIGPELRVADWMRPEGRASELERPDVRYSDRLTPSVKSIQEM